MQIDWWKEMVEYQQEAWVWEKEWDKKQETKHPRTEMENKNRIKSETV